MRPESQHFLAVTKFGRTFLPELWQTLSDVMTLESGKQRETLRLILDELCNAKLIKYPKSQRLWNKSALPHLPAWVSRATPKKIFEHANDIIWSPELSFFADTKKRSDSPWIAVDTWLKKNRGKQLNKKPLRERSLDIFGDEKALDALVATTVFKNGLITFDSLGCFYVPEPIPWAPGPIGSESKCGICVENATTYDTLCRFNKEAGLWGFVAYGRGNNFVSMTDGVVQVLESYGHKCILYFGDADHEGIEIAARGVKGLAESGISIELDSRLYAILIESGTEASAKSGGELSQKAAALVMNSGLLPLIDIFRRNRRIAQEWAGIDALRRTFNHMEFLND
jgi:hypothetical protein